MLDRLDANGAPLLDLGRCLGLVPLWDGALREHRYDTVSPQLGGFLDDKIHRLALGHGLIKRDLERQRGDIVFLDDFE